MHTFPNDTPTEGPFYRCGACGEEYDGKQNNEHPDCPVKSPVEAVEAICACEHCDHVLDYGTVEWCARCGATRAEETGNVWRYPLLIATV